MSKAGGYPSNEELDVPDMGELSPDLSYFLGWLVQHNRLWLLCSVLVALLAGSIAVAWTQTQRYQPTVAYVDLGSGLPVVVAPEGEITVDGVTYRPVHMRAVVKAFIEHRYGYDWQDMLKINRAIEFMNPAAVDVERSKIREADLTNRIQSTQAKWRLELDMSAWEVAALGDGRFRVTVPGTAYINDAFRHVDPARPFPKKFNAEVVVGTTGLTDLNPFGYEILQTGTDIIY